MRVPISPLSTELQQRADEHWQWLSAFDDQYLANWDRLMNANDESAMTEAAVGLLPGIEFGRVEIDRASRQLRVRWPRECDEPDTRGANKQE